MLSRQPVKGLFLLLLSIPFTFMLWVAMIHIMDIGYGPGAVVYAVCFTFFWHLGWSFSGWPGRVLTGNRWLLGGVNWVLAMLAVYCTLAIWSYAYQQPFYETPVALWAQTAIFAAVVSLFFCRNQLLLPSHLGHEQPLAGFVNLIWAVVFVPTTLVFVPRLWGLDPFYIPWIWFPLALVVMDFFGGWPFDRLGVPRCGIAYVATVCGLTFLMVAIFASLDLGFFDEGISGQKAAIFAALWTNLGFIQSWLFNMWPYGNWPRPLRGLVATLVTVIISSLVFALLVADATSEQLTVIFFWMFTFMWSLVSLSGLGFFNTFFWGYETDPHGAGLRGLGHTG